MIQLNNIFSIFLIISYNITEKFAYFIGNINADLLCLLQQRLNHGTTAQLQRTDSHQHQHLSRVIYSSKTKIVSSFFPNFI